MFDLTGKTALVTGASGAIGSELRHFLTASEQEIRSRANDTYWRWYFRLTAGAAH